MLSILQVLFLFVVAGFAEIGGGWLVWQWLRAGRPWTWGLGGSLLLMMYGIIPTFQPPGLDFGKVYAAYGGAFIALSLLWGWMVDGVRPDMPSTVGAGIALVGAAIIVYWPRV